MKIDVKSKYNIDDILYKLKINLTIDSYKIVDISYNNKEGFFYKITNIKPIHGCYVTEEFSEALLEKENYFLRKEDILKKIIENYGD